MLPSRFTYALASAVLVGIGLAWIISESAWIRPQATTLLPGRYYAIAAASDSSTFDLDFQPGARYSLIVSSLGSADGNRKVTLEAETVRKTSICPAQPIQPLRPKRLPRKNVGWDRGAQSGWVSETDRSACRHRAAGQETAGQEKDREQGLKGVSRSFFLHVTDGALDDPRHYARVSSRVVAEGRRVRIYLDTQQTVAELVPGVLNEMVRLFDEEIIPRSQAKLGNCRDIDGDGKFSVLMSPWLSRLQGGKTSLGGFVRGSDFHCDLAAPFSNHGDMLYLNSNVRPGPHLQSLLAHEFAHAVCFSVRLPSERYRLGLPEEEDWLNEAIAHLSENLQGCGWSNLDYRVSRFMTQPQAYPLVVSDYYQAGLWRDHGCRGATYLFLRWCVDQFGNDMLPRLIRSPVRGAENLEWATGVKFEELYRRWSVALLQSGQQTTSPSAAPATSTLHTATLHTAESPAAKSSSVQQPASRCRDNGCYTSLDLRGRLANWGLAGPRTVSWDVDQGEQTLHLKGTSTAFLELHASKAAGARRIRISADYGTQLQISVVKLPEDWPRIRIETEWIHPTASKLLNGSTAEPAHRLLQVRVEGHAESDLQVELIACERNHRETRQSFCFHGEDLICRQLPNLATDTRGVGGPFELPISPAPRNDGGLIVKVVVQDAQGRRATAWKTVDEFKPEAARRQVAKTSNSRHR